MNLVILIPKFIKKKPSYYLSYYQTQTQYYFQDIYFYISIKLLLTYTMNFLSHVFDYILRNNHDVTCYRYIIHTYIY